MIPRRAFLGLALLLFVLAPTARAAGGLVADYGGCAGTVPSRILDAGPATYLALLPTLGPGDLLRLAPGTYPDGLPLTGTTGQPGNCVIIQGPPGGPKPVFTGRNCCNTVSLHNVSYLVIRGLELDGLGRLGDGVKAEGDADFAHHVTLEDLHIHGHGADQQIVGINTKCEAWNWVIRHNVIEGAGTGLYLGDSTGDQELVHGLVEYNLVTESVGYNMQVKHQVNRSTGMGVPASGTTIIRYNVFSKAQNASTGAAARPNLLVGHWPLSGPGAEDEYWIYGNFFHQNASAAEPLFQGEGNVIFYQNALVNDFGPGILVRAHNDLPRRVRIFQNTVVANGTGIRVRDGAAGFEQRVVGNASFGAPGLFLTGATALDNVEGAYADAGLSLANPDGVITGPTDRLDLHPLPGALGGTPIDLSGLSGYLHWSRDFDGDPRPGTERGAYATAGPGWLLELARRSLFTDGFEGGLGAWTLTEP